MKDVKTAGFMHPSPIDIQQYMAFHLLYSCNVLYICIVSKIASYEGTPIPEGGRNLP